MSVAACEHRETAEEPSDDWSRLRDAYLGPWRGAVRSDFALAVAVGSFARAVASMRFRDALSPDQAASFDGVFATVLRRALVLTTG